jgi:hypothetical protein
MVTGTHEAHHSIFRHDDDLFPEVMEQVFGLVLGKTAEVTCLSTDLTERQPQLVEAGLDGTSSYEIWRDLMITNDYPHVSQWRAQATEQGIEQGSVKTRAEDILRILARRDVSVPEGERAVIEACTDMDTLETWFDRALVIGDISSLFAR